MRPHLDLSAVESFILVADLGSFTHAAEAQGMTQAGVSMKLRRLEDALGMHLFDRTPRKLRLTADGEAFLLRARALLAAEEAALARAATVQRQMMLGVSDYVAGAELPDVLARVQAHDVGLEVKVRVASSSELLRAFERGEIDVAVVRRHRLRRDCESLFFDSYGWFGAISPVRRTPLPLITVEDSCGVRAIAIRLLEQAKIKWVDAFVGGGVATVLAAAASGIGIAPLPRRLAAGTAVDAGELLGLPPLPDAEIMLHAHRVDPTTRATLRMLAAAFRGKYTPAG